MEDKSNIFKSLLERAEEYILTSADLLKLKALEKVSDIISSIVSSVAALVFIFIFFLMLSIGIALWLGQIFDNTSYGFFIVAVFYGIIGIVLFFFMRKWLRKLLGNFIIKKVLK